MRTSVLAFVATLSIVAAGCGGTTRVTTTAPPNPTFPSLSSAVATFVSKDHGKDAGSSMTMQLVRENSELAGNVQVVGTKFDDNSSSGAFAFSLSGPFTTRDIGDGQLRIRFNPDGADDWTFDLHVTMRFSNGTARNFVWHDIRLDNANPERVLTLDLAQVS
jgi:hypothetical protein